MPSFFLSFCYCMLLFSLPLFLSLPTSPYLSFSAYSRPLQSVISAVRGNEWPIFISLCPLCCCCFGTVCNRQRDKRRLYSSLPWGLEPAIHEACKAEEGERKYRGTDREVWYSETKAQSKSRKKMWHRWSRRQTDRQGRIRWVVVSHGEREVSSSGQRHDSNRRYTFFPIIHYCDCFGALCLSLFS